MEKKKNSVRTLINKFKQKEEEANQVMTSAGNKAGLPSSNTKKSSSVSSKISFFNKIDSNNVPEGLVGKTQNIASLPIECVNPEAVKGLKCLTKSSKKPDCSNSILDKVLSCLEKVKGKLDFATHIQFKNIDWQNVEHLKKNTAGAAA